VIIDVVVNKQPGRFDTAHRDKPIEAVLKVVAELSVTEQNGVRVMHMRSAEIADAFGMILAMIASSHKALTPRDRRLLAEETAKRLFRRIDEMRKGDAPLKPDFMSYDDDATH
jgi:hypothetical protein